MKKIVGKMNHREINKEEMSKVKNRGSNEIIAFVLLIVFILLLAAPQIKNLGETVKTAVGNLNTSLSTTLSDS